MAGGGEKAPPNPAQPPRKARPRHGSVHGGSSEQQKQGARAFSPSVSSKDSAEELVTQVRPSKSVDSRSSPCSAGSVGSVSVADPFDICNKFSSIKLNPSLPEINRDKRQDREPSKAARTFSPSVSSKGSMQQLVTPVRPPKSVESRSSPCSAGPVGSDSGAASFDICDKFSSIKLNPSLPEVNRDKRRDGEPSKDVSFDICMSGNKLPIVKLKPSLLEINREKRRERELFKDVASVQHLRSGMVLLKRFIKPNDQAKIVKVCQQLGVGSGGFYRPGYRNGAQLRLRMMCLGKNWDPDSCSYGNARPFDGAQPPTIPEEFRKCVQDAIQASHEFIGADNAVEELPQMSPDICIVNFYESRGRLGLHQDKDESSSSLDKGLPVVSFSLGDTAEFLYGDDRDEEKVSKVDLESGDVLIFGGKSRLIFHGVANEPKTAPKWLTDEASLRPGRLNLTFRQY